MSNNLTLEDHIMACWSIVDDIACVRRNITDTDTSSTLLGIENLYRMKFEELFRCYEGSLKKDMLSTRYFNVPDEPLKKYTVPPVQPSTPIQWPPMPTVTCDAH